MNRPLLFLAAVGLVISLACGGAGAPTLTECAEHPTCKAGDLLECMCDSSGALHTAEGFCPARFDPPCAAGETCDVDAAFDAECVKEGDMGGGGGGDSGAG